VQSMVDEDADEPLEAISALVEIEAVTPMRVQSSRPSEDVPPLPPAPNMLLADDDDEPPPLPPSPVVSDGGTVEDEASSFTNSAAQPTTPTNYSKSAKHVARGSLAGRQIRRQSDVDMAPDFLSSPPILGGEPSDSASKGRSTLSRASMMSSDGVVDEEVLAYLNTPDKVSYV
jgi:hypothetical protein